MSRGRPTKYLHLLRAMRAGDVLYLPAPAARFDRQLSGVAYRHGGELRLANHVALESVTPETIQHILRVTCIKPLKG